MSIIIVFELAIIIALLIFMLKKRFVVNIQNQPAEKSIIDSQQKQNKLVEIEASKKILLNAKIGESNITNESR